MEASLKAFMKGIIDYAGLFPPADLSLDTSIQNYSSYRQCDESWMLSRFIIPAMKLDQLKPYRENLFQDDRPYEFSVLGKGTETAAEYFDHLKDVIAKTEDFHAYHDDRVTTDILEIKLPREAIFGSDPQLLSDIYEQTLEQLDESSQTPNEVFFEGYFEENWKKEIGLLLRTLSKQNESFDGTNIIQAAFKLRCGGVESHMVPSVEQVAFALNTVSKHNLALKATAGLHHPIRHYSDEVQTTMHGFFNVFGGAMLCHLHNLSDEELEEVLLEEDPEHFKFSDDAFRWKDLKVSTDEISKLREESLISFGSCSFDEPREYLKQLNLL